MRGKVTLIAVEDGTSRHTGSTVVGPVAGTLAVGSNSFCKINGKLIMVDNGTMNIPTHKYQSSPDLYHSHSYPCNTFGQSFVKVEGRKVILLNDSYSGDATSVNGVGSNSFCGVTP